MARSFAEAGAQLTLVARDEAALTNLSKTLGCTHIAGDLLNPSFTDALIARASAETPIDVLVNNAGMEVIGHLHEHTAEQIRAVLRLNLEVPAVLIRAVLGSMLERGRGHIVNVSSMAMAVNTPGFSTYGASKSALSALGGSLVEELRGTGVGVTTVEIGTADTEMLSNLRSSQVQGVFKRYENLGMSPLLHSSDVADAVRSGIERNKQHVRMPKRQAALPMLVNAPRSLGKLVTRGVSTR
jgi:short-subunit dehydrogenase